MAKIDQRLVDLLKSYGETAEACWDCHGTWVAYHAAIERMAAKAGIKFDLPQMIVNDYVAKTVVVCVAASLKDAKEWSFGEVSPSNNKNSYPYAMAEKRAKDRVALKLLGMSGLVYSEEEADDFKESKPKSSAALKRDDAWTKAMADLEQDMLDVGSEAALEALRASYISRATNEGWTLSWKESLADEFLKRKDQIREASLWNELTTLTSLRGLKTFWEDNSPAIKALGPTVLKTFTAKKDEMKTIMEAKNSPLSAG